MLNTRRIDVGGTARAFLLAEPQGTPTAIFLSLHGTRSSADQQARYSRMEGFARQGAAVAFPQAVAPIGPGFEWDHQADLPFLVALVDELRCTYPVPSGRVCTTGMSGGARMSCLLATHYAEGIQMVGAVAGMRAPEGGTPSRSVPVVAFHGTSDRINPYDGGGSPRWMESVPAAAAAWAATNGVAGGPTQVAISPTLTKTTYGAEGQPGEVTLYTAAGAGHTWPGSKPGPLLRLLLGRTNTDIDATAEIERFAQAHAQE
ncbi:MAG: alpha/beta hydrolase family esterase [Acidimicrobiales bacterium]